MTAARHLSLVATNVIPLPRRPHIEHNALRHAVLREAAGGLIVRDGRHVEINQKPTGPATRAELDALEGAGLLAWFPFGDDSGHVGWITASGAEQLAEWDGPGQGGDAA